MLHEHLLGVDEAGRGPLAGPVAVGVVSIPLGFDILQEFPGVKDSKELTGQKRERIYDEVERRAVRGDLRFCVKLSDHSYIDTFGISAAVREAVWSGVRELGTGTELVLLDGLLRAPEEFVQQRTYIKGDSRVPAISLASIVAKVTRDRLMEDISSDFPEYGFEQHKGYGTRAHLEAIRLHGLTTIHRRSFCRGVTP